jgi:heptaprenyl diphosphate synthase
VVAPNAIAGVEVDDPQLAATLETGLERVEDMLHREVRSDYAFVAETSLHLIDAGGKRFRPLFTLLAAQTGPQPDSDDVVRAAAVVELIHLATLYHDDVMDAATMRRGAESANARWDNSVAILTGDFLFAHASRLVADLGPEAVRIIAETFAELVTGQMRETRGPRPGEDPVSHYLTVIAEKTGSLIATSGRYGGMFSGCGPEHIASLHRFGALIGTAPMLYALQGHDTAADRLRELLAHPISDDAEVAEALELLRGGPGLTMAAKTIADQAAAARSELRDLPACPATDALAALTTFVVDRTA